MKNKLFPIAFMSLVLALSQLYGQATSGDVTGTVADQSGAVIPSVNLTIQNDQTGVKTTAVSNANGNFRFFNLPIGFYTLTAMASGFGTTTQKGLRVELSNTVTVNLTMSVSSTSTTVEVSEAPESATTRKS